MRHLTDETLARIADGPATEEERAHLTECRECGAGLEEMKEQLAAIGALPPPRAPAAVRERVEAALLARGRAAADRPSLPYGRWALRAAAGVALFVGGAAVGAGIDRDTTTVVEPEPATVLERGSAAVETNPATDASTSLASVESVPDEPAVEPVGVREADPGGIDRRPIVRRAAERPRPADPEAALREAEARYVEALARYVDDRGAPLGGDPTNRLAALEGILHTTRAALVDSPGDPVLEGFYRSALVHREATMGDVTITTAQAVY